MTIRGMEEVDHEHVDDERLIVDLRLERVVVNPLQALHALRDVLRPREGQRPEGQGRPDVRDREQAPLARVLCQRLQQGAALTLGLTSPSVKWG